MEREHAPEENRATMPNDAPDVVLCRGGGVSFAVETRGSHLPRVLHCGAVATSSAPRYG